MARRRQTMGYKALAALAALLAVAFLTHPLLPGSDAAAPVPSPKQASVQQEIAAPGATTEPSAPQPNLQSAKVVRVVDGDTLVLDIEGVQDKVRLIGVDAPESVHPDKSRNTPAGKEASDYMKGIAAPGREVWLQSDVADKDKYGRLLRYVWLEKPSDTRDTSEVKSKMLNALIEEAGHARPMAIEPDTAYKGVFESMPGQLP